jgi:hypothetical protein
MAEDKQPKDQPADMEREIQSGDFQFILKELLAAYQPILEEELKRAKEPERLKKEGVQKPSCDEELALANRLFEKFASEAVALRLLPPQARELLGPSERWRWCLQHILCCYIFGWLACRWPRTFRGFAYYLYQYWKCVRQVVGNPVSDPPTPEQREDFAVLVKTLATAFKPYLTDQLATVDFSDGVPDEVISGEINCFTDDQDACVIFERLLTTEAARALLGKATFEQYSREPFFWFCRCWCLCALCFGCCLARARSIQQVLLCLYYYWRCLRDCFRPLVCEITFPSGCVVEHAIPSQNILRGIEILGTVTGAFCDHYTIQWKDSLSLTFQNAGVRYPGGGAQGVCGVISGTLGYIETFPFVHEGPVEIEVCVYSTQGGPPHCCTANFQLQRNLVWIDGLEGITADASLPPFAPPYNPAAQLVDTVILPGPPPTLHKRIRSFGTAVRIFGSAAVGGCAGRDIKRITLSYQPGFTTTLGGAWTQFWEVDYNTLLQLDAYKNGNAKLIERVLTSVWNELNFPPAICNPLWDWLSDAYWSTQVPQSFPVVPFSPPCPPQPFFTSTPLPLTNCQSGRYTVRLTVEDTGGVTTDDLQQVWFDNKPIHGKITQIAGIDPCATLNLSQFALGGGDCSLAWPANLLGIAFDEFIEEGNAAIPSDNYAQVGGIVQGGYQLWIKKDGAPDPGHALPIPGPGAPPWGPPFLGTTRVGFPNPAERCQNPAPPPGPVPPETPGILAIVDMRRLDAVCNPSPTDSDLTLQRGECCGFIVKLVVKDISICPSLSDGVHSIEHNFPFCICNDLPPVPSR